MLIAVVAYLFIGLVVMSAMQVYWGLIESLLGVILWPITLLFLIRTKLDERKRKRKGECLSFESIAVILAISELYRIAAEKAAEKPDAWTPDRN